MPSYRTKKRHQTPAWIDGVDGDEEEKKDKKGEKKQKTEESPDPEGEERTSANTKCSLMVSVPTPKKSKSDFSDREAIAFGKHDRSVTNPMKAIELVKERYYIAYEHSEKEKLQGLAPDTAKSMSLPKLLQMMVRQHRAGKPIFFLHGERVGDTMSELKHVAIVKFALDHYCANQYGVSMLPADEKQKILREKSRNHNLFEADELYIFAYSASHGAYVVFGKHRFSYCYNGVNYPLPSRVHCHGIAPLSENANKLETNHAMIKAAKQQTGCKPVHLEAYQDNNTERDFLYGTN